MLRFQYTPYFFPSFFNLLYVASLQEPQHMMFFPLVNGKKNVKYEEKENMNTRDNITQALLVFTLAYLQCILSVHIVMLL